MVKKKGGSWKRRPLGTGSEIGPDLEGIRTDVRTVGLNTEFTRGPNPDQRRKRGTKITSMLKRNPKNNIYDFSRVYGHNLQK